MAGMAALQGAMGALSVSAASTSAFWGNPLAATFSAAPSGVITNPCPDSGPLFFLELNPLLTAMLLGLQA